MLRNRIHIAPICKVQRLSCIPIRRVVCERDCRVELRLSQCVLCDRGPDEPLGVVNARRQDSVHLLR